MTYGRQALLLAASSLLALPASGQSRRLNGPLPRPGASDCLEDFAFSRDGARLVFRGDVFEDGAFELFSSPANASAPPVRLNAPLAAGGDVVSFALGSQRVAYIADQDTDEVFELYSVPIAGGGVLKLSGELVGGGDVLQLLLTPDGASAVVLADGLVDGRPEFFRVPLDGSSAPLALDPSPNEQEVALSRISPDGTRILFTRREIIFLFNFYVDRLFSLALDGSQSKLLIAEAHPPSVPVEYIKRSIVDLEFSPDGQRALYTDQIEAEDGPDEVFLNSALVDGSQAPIVLSQGASNDHLDFSVSSSLGRVVYFELGNAFSIAFDGTGRVQLDPPGWTTLSNFALTPDGSSVLFDARNTALLRGLLHARVDGSQPASLLDGPGNFTITEVAPTDTRVFYASRNGPAFEFTGFAGVYAVPLDGSAAPLLLNGPAVDRTGGNALQPTSSGSLVFRNSFSTDGVFELHAVPQDGSLAPHRISGPLSGGRDVLSYRLAPGGDAVAYRADQTYDGAFELFRTTVSRGKVTNFIPLSVGPVVGDVLSFQLAPDARSLVFEADQDTDDEFRLYSVPTSGKGSPTQVGRLFSRPGIYKDEFAFVPASDRIVRFNRATTSSLYSVSTAPGSSEVTLGSARVVGPLEFTPDGARMVFVFMREQSGAGTGLMSARLAAPGMVALFNVVGRRVLGHQLTPDGSTVVYVADAAALDRFELFRKPVTGGAAVKLNPALAANRDVSAFRITPDGTGVVYLADANTAGQFELFVVPLDLGTPARRLSADLVTGTDVVDFAFTPDGAGVVYRAGGTNRIDLFRVSLSPSATRSRRAPGDGEPDVVQLTSLTRSMVQPDYAFAAEGTQIVFRADVFRGPGLEPDRPELFRVPLVGGGSPTRLSRPVDEDGLVLSFVLAPDGKGIAYLADERGDDRRELFSVGVFGGPIVALDPLPAFADVSVYHITPDSRAVVYLSDRNLDEASQLFRVPIDGSTPPVALNDPLPAGGDVEADFVALPDGVVVYRADQESDEVFELFANHRFLR